MSKETTMTPLKMRIGDVELIGVSDGPLKTSIDYVIGMERAEAESLVGQTDAGSFYIPVNNFVIRRGGNTILIDAGAGSTMQPTLGKLPDNLRAAGVDPRAVTHIVLTHIHPDHANGLVDASGQANYPNAEVLVHQTEADFWLRADAGAEPESVARNRARAQVNFAPYRDRLRRVRDGEDILGCTPMLAPGHTPGHTCWRIELGKSAMLAWGDVVHFAAIQVSHPDTAVTYDLDKDLARRSRRRVLDMVATDRLAVAGAHLSQPGFGYIVRRGSSYAFEAAS